MPFTTVRFFLAAAAAAVLQPRLAGERSEGIVFRVFQASAIKSLFVIQTIQFSHAFIIFNN